jgi:hypothetical protein
MVKKLGDGGRRCRLSTTVKVSKRGNGCVRPGWTKSKSGVHRDSTCGARWTHDDSGWVVHHCGHPTANWPYYGEDPTRPGGILIPSGFYPAGTRWVKGWAFRTLELAQLAVERLHAEQTQGGAS